MRTFVNFPSDTLSLRHFTCHQDCPPCYELLGIVNHFGTLEGGHYKANIKQILRSGQRRWFKYDDQEVTEIDSKDVISQDAYILFYVSQQF